MEIITTSAIIVLIVSLLTTILTLIFTRKNLRTTKYIETITIEKIKWVESIRNDLSLLLTSLLIFKNNREKFHKIDFEAERISYVRHLTDREILEDNELESDYHMSELLSNFRTAFERCLTPTEIVIKATQIKLRLHLDQNMEICDILDRIISEYSIIDFDFRHSRIDLIKLSNLAQVLLTKYWDEIIDELNKK